MRHAEAEKQARLAGRERPAFRSPQEAGYLMRIGVAIDKLIDDRLAVMTGMQRGQGGIINIEAESADNKEQESEEIRAYILEKLDRIAEVQRMEIQPDSKSAEDGESQ